MGRGQSEGLRNTARLDSILIMRASWPTTLLILLGIGALVYVVTLPSIQIWVTFRNDADEELKVSVLCAAEDLLVTADIPARAEKRMRIYAGDDTERFHRYTFVIAVTNAQGLVVDSFTMSGKELQARGQITVGSPNRPATTAPGATPGTAPIP